MEQQELLDLANANRDADSYDWLRQAGFELRSEHGAIIGLMPVEGKTAEGVGTDPAGRTAYRDVWGGVWTEA